MARNDVLPAIKTSLSRKIGSLFGSSFGKKPAEAIEPAIRTAIISMVRNEQDIIEPFLRHNAQFADLLILIDNCSTDDTRRIAFETARELGNVVITDNPNRAYAQSEIMSQALRYVQSAVFADYVLFLDADEFIQAESPAAFLDSLSSMKARSLCLVPWKTFLPNPDKPETDHIDPLDRVDLQRDTEEPQYFKAILRMAGHWDPSLEVLQGNHQIKDGKGNKLPFQTSESLALAHIPIRSSEQVLTKGAIGWKANARRSNLKPNEAKQWKQLHDKAVEGSPLSPEDLALEALNYASQSPKTTLSGHVVGKQPDIMRTRRFSDGRFAPSERLIADDAEERSGTKPPLPLPSHASSETSDAKVDTAFDANWHWDHIYLDEPPFRFAIDYFEPASVLDLGCGSGLYPLLYRHLGVEMVLGVDGMPITSTALEPENYVEADLQKPFDAGRTFDLVICLEVAEHLNPDCTDTFFDSVARNAKDVIIFSMAEPGQPGNGHINCLSMAEILALWAARGWHPDLPLTLGMRAISTTQWFRKNILVLRRAPVAPDPDAARVLEMIGRKTFAWYTQSFGQWHAPFTQDFAPAELGYGPYRGPTK